jgi:hypothetical protein
MVKKTKRLGRPPLKIPTDAPPLYIRLSKDERAKLEAASERARSRTLVEWARQTLLRIADGMAP